MVSIASLIWDLIDSYVLVAIVLLVALNTVPSISAAGKKQRRRIYWNRPID
jgi:hypothetical protein